MAVHIKYLVQSLPATRPPFLILAPVCVFLGTALSFQQNNELLTLNLVFALFASLCAAITVNCLNEYQDFQSGLDLTTKPTPFSGGSGLLKTSPHLANTVLIIFQASTLLLSLIGG